MSAHQVLNVDRTAPFGLRLVLTRSGLLTARTYIRRRARRPVSSAPGAWPSL